MGARNTYFNMRYVVKKNVTFHKIAENVDYIFELTLFGDYNMDNIRPGHLVV